MSLLKSNNALPERPSSVQRDRGKESGKNRRKKKKSRKCTKQRFRDYFIESDGCRLIIALNNTGGPAGHHRLSNVSIGFKVALHSLIHHNADYQHISHRSKRPYKMAKCVGGGGNSCVANKVQILNPSFTKLFLTYEYLFIFQDHLEKDPVCV